MKVKIMENYQTSETIKPLVVLEIANNHMGDVTHGKNLIEAENFLDIWLPKLQMEDNLAGIIIHGKGYGSGIEGPKLKNFVDQYLQYNPNVLAYHSAQQRDGGTGAVYVQLKNIS